ncbi:hypothetical protein [Spiroplasma endosymbiont of Glossina fuscipes fuscipes]|uniref:hypothetical protein n=1 Tax=Spiroplasma endosymbiont of Glossina fuscipes fuscipes TaxID=2004463 RepID=UPI003C70BABC
MVFTIYTFLLTTSATAIPIGIVVSTYQKQEQNSSINKENIQIASKTKRCNTIYISKKPKRDNVDNMNSSQRRLNSSGPIWFNFEHKDMAFTLQYYYNIDTTCYYMIDINIEEINPSNYNRIIFYVRDNFEDQFTFATWGNTRLYGKKINQVLYGDLKDLMTEIKVEDNWDDISKYLHLSPLQYVKDYKEGLAYLNVSQRAGLTYYYDPAEEAYHLQILIGQYAGAISSFSGGMVQLGIGSYLELLN